MVKKAGNFLRPRVRRTHVSGRPPSSTNFSGMMPGPGCAELQLRLCPRPSRSPGEGSDRRRSPET